MATGRTVLKHSRIYVDGYNLSGYARQFGPLSQEYETAEDAALTDPVKGAWCGQGTISPGTINAYLETNVGVTAMHDTLATAGVNRVLLAAIGIRAAPAMGDPVFCGQFVNSGYQYEGSPNVYVNMPFGKTAGVAANMRYSKPWGVLLHAEASENAVNAAIGIDDNGAASAFGGFMVYQLLSVTGAGTVTLKVQDAAVNANGSFADLVGATSGAIANTAAPTAGVVAIGTTATVRQFLRWQLVFGGGSTAATFLLAFVRSLGPGL